MAQQFVAAHEDEFGVLGRIQAAIALSSSLESWQASQTKERGEVNSAVNTWLGQPDPEPELSAEEQEALEAARRALEAEEARRLTRAAEEGPRRAARRALSREDRAMLEKAEKELAAAKAQLDGVDRRLTLLDGQEADTLRRLAEGGLTEEQEVVLRARLEKVRGEKNKLKLKQKQLRDKIARVEANLRLILAGGGAKMREDAAANLRNAARGEATTRTRPRSAGVPVAPLRNPYVGTRWDPGLYEDRAHLDRSNLSAGLGFSSPIQCPPPVEHGERWGPPGSAMLVQRSPSAEERFIGHVNLLAAEHTARSLELRYIAPPPERLREAKMARKWEKLTVQLVQRAFGAKPSACSTLEPDDGGRFNREKPYVSAATISAAADVFVGTAATHPVLAAPLASARSAAKSDQMARECALIVAMSVGSSNQRQRQQQQQQQQQQQHSRTGARVRQRPSSAGAAVSTRARPPAAVPAAVAYSLSAAGSSWADTVVNETTAEFCSRVNETTAEVVEAVPSMGAAAAAVELQNSSEEWPAGPPPPEQQQLEPAQWRGSPPTAALEQYIRLEVKKPTPPTARRDETATAPYVAMASTGPSLLPADEDPWIAIGLGLALGREERRQRVEEQRMARPPKSVLFQTGGVSRSRSSCPQLYAAAAAAAASNGSQRRGLGRGVVIR